MAGVDPLFAQWLQRDADWSVRTDPAASARWAATAVTSERATGIATRAAADAEANRLLAFFSRGPYAIEVHQVGGEGWERELGRVVTLTIEQLGYDAGLDVIVIATERDRSTGLNAVTVARPLSTGA